MTLWSLPTANTPLSSCTIPLKSPDKGKDNMKEDKPENRLSFKDILVEKNLQPMDYFDMDLLHQDIAEEEFSMEEDIINLTFEEKARLYSPCHFALIIRSTGRKFNHQYMRTKLTDLWKVKKI